MADENTPPGAFSSIDDAVAALRQSRDQAKGEDEAKPDEVEAEVAEVEAETPDEPEAEVEAEAEPQDDDEPEALYEVEGETFTLAELREWKKGALRQADYTRKTQEVAEARKAIEAERAALEAERQQTIQQLRAEQEQLRDALATFAIEQTPEPDPTKYPNWTDYVKAKKAYDDGKARKTKAAQAYQALQAKEHESRLEAELNTLFRKKPEWRTPEAWKSTTQGAVEVATAYGFTPEEVAGIVDHRMFLILDDLRNAKATAGTVKAAQSAADKKAVQAVKKLAPGAKPNPQNQATKAIAETRDRLKKTGSADDAVAYMQARRRSQG